MTSPRLAQLKILSYTKGSSIHQDKSFTMDLATPVDQNIGFMPTPGPPHGAVGLAFAPLATSP